MEPGGAPEVPGAPKRTQRAPTDTPDEAKATKRSSKGHQKSAKGTPKDSQKCKKNAKAAPQKTYILRTPENVIKLGPICQKV